MDTLYFITGNDDKFREVKELLPEIQRLDIDLPEVQSLDPEVVIREKLNAARDQRSGSFIVEDTSLYLDGLNGFPGPLIKWLMQAVGNQGIYELTSRIMDYGAIAKTMIGYSDADGNVTYFESSLIGKIVAPVSEPGQGFGWDEIFQPDGTSESFAEMGNELKAEFSMRSDAVKKLKQFLAK